MRCLSLAQCSLPCARHNEGVALARPVRSSSRQARRVASASQMMEFAAGSALNLQDTIVTVTVLGLIAASVVAGLKGEPKVCEICKGTGGARCFACEGTGSQAVDASTLEKRPTRDFVGRSFDPTKCRVCGGSGLVLCRQCKGSGYQKRL